MCAPTQFHTLGHVGEKARLKLPPGGQGRKEGHVGNGKSDKQRRTDRDMFPKPSSGTFEKSKELRSCEDELPDKTLLSF